MSQPTAYTRQKNFTEYALAHTSQPYNASDHDAEFNAVATTLTGVTTNLALIQRDDGKIINGGVHPDSLSTSTKALIASDWTPRGLWVTATAYVVGDVVEDTNVSYVCATAHTAGVFATDRAAGKWIVLGSTNASGVAASGVSFSPTGGIAATDVQNALAEVDSEKANKAGSASQVFQVSDPVSGANDAMSLGHAQQGKPWFAVGAGSGDAITATLASGLTALYNGMEVAIRAPSSNGTNAPTLTLTLGSTSTGAISIRLGDTGGALSPGDIAGASHELRLRYNGSLNYWMLLNPKRVLLSTSNIADQRSLMTYLLPSPSDGWRGIYRSGFDWWSRNQQWGGPWGGELFDGAAGTLYRTEFATGNIDNDSSRLVGAAGGTTWQAQGFKVPETQTVTAIWLKIYKIGNPTGNFSPFIYTDTAGAPNALHTNGTATPQSGKLHTSDTDGQWYRFTFATPPTLTGGTQYHIACKSSAAVDASNHWVWKLRTAKTYPFGNGNTGDNTPTWTARSTESFAFLVELSSGALISQSGGLFDGKMSFGGAGASGTLSMSRGLCSTVPLRELMDTQQSTIRIAGQAFTKDATILDIGFGQDHDRIVLRSNVTTGYAQVDLYESDGTKHTVTGNTDISSGTQDIAIHFRAKGDGSDKLELYVNGSSQGTPVTGATITFDDNFRNLGTMWVGGGFAVAPTWTQKLAMGSLPSADSPAWTWTGTATEADAMSVSAGRLRQNYGGYTSAQTGYYALTTSLVNGTGWAVAAKAQVLSASNTVAENGSSILVFDGSARIDLNLQEYYAGVIGSGTMYAQHNFRNYESTVLLVGKGSDGLAFINNKLVCDVTGTMNSTATNAINFGDRSGTAGENADVIWDYVAYHTSPLLPQFTAGSISELAIWAGDRTSILSSLYNSAAPVSVKQYCGLPLNYIDKSAAIKRIAQKGIASSPTTTSTSYVVVPELECFVVGERISTQLTNACQNSTISQSVSLVQYIDGVLMEVSYMDQQVAARTDMLAVDGEQVAALGLHKVEGRWNVTANTGLSVSTHRRMIVGAKP